MNANTQKAIRLATPCRYEGGVISLLPGPRALRADELAALHAGGYEVLEVGLVGWGRHQAVIRDSEGRTYLARLAR